MLFLKQPLANMAFSSNDTIFFKRGGTKHMENKGTTQKRNKGNPHMVNKILMTVVYQK